MNTWVNFTYVDPQPEAPASTVCSVPGCGKPRHPMGEKYFRKLCKEHHADWMKDYQYRRRKKT